MSAFLGAWSLGVTLTLQARVAALTQDGTFRALGPLVIGATAGILLGSAAAQLLSRRAPGEALDLPRHEHPSMLSAVAVHAARTSALNIPLLFASLSAPLLSALPLGALLLLAEQSAADRSSNASTLIVATTSAAFLFFTANGLKWRSAPWLVRLEGLRIALALFGLFGGLFTASRVSSELFGLDEFATAAVLVASMAAILCLMNSGLDRIMRPLAVAIVILGTGKAAPYVYSKFDQIYEQLTDAEKINGDERFARVLENRHGVLTITTSGWLHENGRLQGIFNTNPIPAVDFNRSARAYVIPAALKNPETILFLGLGSGSFAQILAHYPAVKSLTILEENPAYEKAVQNSGMVASLLENERVKIVYGGVDSTLKQQGKFDVILSDLLPFRKDAPSPFLTKEFFEQLSSHLNPRGAVYINTQNSPRVERALVDTFPYLLRYQDMIFGSKERLRVDGYQWMRDLMAWEIDGHKVLATRKDPTEVARHIVQNRDFRGSFAWEREEALRERTKSTAPLTLRATDAPWWHFKILP